jgi:succinoglycan biosynthesis protein ExoO
MTMAVSVVVAAYNAERLLARAVESALQQTAPPAEIIVVDDASTDSTPALAHDLADQHASVRVIRQERNGGPAAARNSGFAAATGDWIAVLDADDTYTPGRLAALASAVDESCDVVLDNFLFYNVSTGKTRPSRIPPVDQDISLHQYLDRARAFNYEPTWTLLKPLFRRDFLHEHALAYQEDVRHGEDFLLMVDAFLAGARVRRIGGAGYLYSEWKDGESRTRPDYVTLAAKTRALMDHPRLRNDKVAVKLLRRRIATLECRRAEVAGVAPLVRSALTKPGVAATLARRGFRRGSRVFGVGARPAIPDTL